MRAAKTLQDKVNAVNALYERSGEVAYRGGRYGILGAQNINPAFNRFTYAQDALAALVALASAASPRAVVQHTTTHHTRIGDVHVHTPASDPKAHAAAVRKDLSTNPLIGPVAQQQVILSTRGSQ